MLEGDLSDFSLPDVLRLLAFTSKSGRLQLRDGDARGRVDLAAGRVRDASADTARLPLARRLLSSGIVDAGALRRSLDDTATLPTDLGLARLLVDGQDAPVEPVTDALRAQTVDAVFDLHRWSGGAFRFDVADADGSEPQTPVPPAVDLTVDELLAELDARDAGYSELEAHTGADDAVVSLRRAHDGVGQVPVDGWDLLTLVDGRRTVAELALLSGHGTYATRGTLAGLLDAGLIEIGEPSTSDRIGTLLAGHQLLTALEQRFAQPPGARSAPTPVPAPEPEPEPSAPPEVVLAPAASAPPVPSEAAGRPPAPSVPTTPSAPSAPLPPASGGLRTQVRPERLSTDPAIDEDLVSRLIAGVENL